MNANVRRILLAVSAIFTLGLAACGGGISCDSTLCPKDDKPTQAQMDACEKVKSGACGSATDDVASCVSDNITCNADDKSDLDALVKVADKCKTQQAALTKCCADNSGAEGCS